ncbi:MAG: ABC transporter permease subunit [Actinomycetota bacterium]|nr:ABC transporter permease subunit [Actinomycetota bacterium]
MRNIGNIAVNVIKDSFRRKLFLFAFIFGVALLGISPVLPTFELGIRASFLRDISLSLSSIFGVILALILSVNQISQEMEKRTIYNVLSKPVSRLEYFLGKYFGILATIIVILLIMFAEVLVLIFVRIGVFTPILWQGFLAIFLECSIIASFSLTLSPLTSIPINVFSTILFYSLTHLKSGFLYEKLVEGIHGAARIFTWLIYYLIPNLENFNLSQEVGYGKGVSAPHMLRITGYAVLFACAFVIIGFLLFRRKDL